MILIPYKKQIFTTKFTEEQIKHILQENIAPLPKFPYQNIPTEQLKYTGWLFEKGFKIFRQFDGRKGFLPFIVGKFDNSEIAITFRLPYSGVIFFAIWFTFFGLGIFFIFMQDLSIFQKIFFPAIYVLLYVIIIINFNLESRRGMEFLNNLFIKSLTKKERGWLKR